MTKLKFSDHCVLILIGISAVWGIAGDIFPQLETEIVRAFMDYLPFIKFIALFVAALLISGGIVTLANKVIDRVWRG